MEYETEEQQVEAIKTFWKENGMVIIIGAVLGLGGVYGWRTYSENQITQAEKASNDYNLAVEVVGKNEEIGQQQLNDIIKAGDVKAYAILAAFQSARVAVEQKQLPLAEEKLTYILDTSEVDSIKAIAALRLARVQMEQGKNDQALASLERISLESFTSMVEELRGDIYSQTGDMTKARGAYQAALAAGEGNNVLQMKLNQLAETANISG